MKNFIRGISLLVFTFILMGCQKGVTIDQLPVFTQEVYEELTQQEATYSLYVGSDTCPYCKEFKPKLEEALHDKDTIYYLNADVAEETFKQDLSQQLNIQTIPYLATIKGNEVVHQLDYHLELTPDEVREFLD